MRARVCSRVDVFLRCRVRAWTSCVRCHVRAFARGYLPMMPHASVAVLRSFSRACVLRSHVDVFLRCRVRAWPSCIRSHVHACCVRMWTSFYDAACVRGCLVFVLTCMRAAFVRACVRGRLACVHGRLHAYVSSILHVSSFDFVSVPDRYINKVLLIITAINLHILMYLINGNTIAMLVNLGLL